MKVYSNGPHLTFIKEYLMFIAYEKREIENIYNIQVGGD